MFMPVADYPPCPVSYHDHGNSAALGEEGGREAG